MKRPTRIALAFAMMIACASGLSCKLNDYCLQCGVGDGGPGDATGNGDADAPDDGGGDGGNCVPDGPEICDGKDNDCNGLIDDGVLPGIGDLCTNQMGECAGGVQQCTPTYHCSVTVAKACNGPTDATTCPSGEICNADAKTTDRITCTKNPSPELCDNKDNNCNGMIDEGNPLNGMPTKCGQMGGTCVQGQNICAVAPNCGATGQPACGTISCVGAIGPQPEVCDTLDNDCDGNVDEDLTNLGPCGAPEPGCASPPCGLCVIGHLACVDTNGGTVASQVCIGATNPVLEQCDTFDNDCDGKIDEDFDFKTDRNNCGGCGIVCGGGLPNEGNADWACQLNPLTGTGKCVITSCKAGYHDNNNSPTDGCEFGVCFSSGPEVCDGQDNDCDGMIDEMAGIGGAPPICATQGECAGTTAACPCMDTPDSAGCTTGGTCTTTCATPGGWKCNYGSTVSTDTNGNIIPETKCDQKDNDCDGIIDDHQPQVAHSDGTPLVLQSCDDGKLGICRGTGHFACDDGSFPGSTPGGNLNGPALCDITAPGQAQGVESCNNLDDDCDGVVDNGASTGNLAGQTWINIGGGHQMMQFEASRPDATTTNAMSTKLCNTVTITAVSEAGSAATYTTSAAHGFTVGRVVIISGVTNTSYNGTYLVTAVPTTTKFTVTLATTGLTASSGGSVSTNCVATCSQTNSQPWTNVTYLQALGACQSIGATLCTESTWHRACSGVTPSMYPLSTDGTGLLIEAEDYYSASPGSNGTTRAWVEDETVGFFGISDLAAQPNTGGNITAANAPTQSPRLDYQINYTATSNNYHACIHMFANNANDNQVWVGSNTTLPGTAINTAVSNGCATYPCWAWIQSPAINIAATGNQFLSIYMAKDGTKVDALYLVNGTCPATLTNTNEAGTVNGTGFKWAMQPTPGYTTNVCNDVNYTGAGSGGPLPSGSRTSCYANDNGAQAFDMSGNVKEWSLAHQPGENPIRGGAFGDTSVGIDCPLNFTLADDKFFFPDVGFRCCR